MPIYEYQCIDCRQTFEVRRCFSEADTQVNCIHCESQSTQKLLSKFYAKSPSQSGSISQASSGCGGCSGGSCGSCRH